MREGALSELLHADDLVLICEILERLWNNFSKWKKAFLSKGLRVNLGKNQGNGLWRHHKGWLV